MMDQKPNIQKDSVSSEQEKLIAEIDELESKVEREEISATLAEVESKRLFSALEAQIENDLKHPRKDAGRNFKPQWAKLFIFVALIAILFFIVAFRPQIREYQIYLFESHPSIDFAFNQLSEEWSEADLKAKFPTLNIICENDSSLGNMGDRSCYSRIAKHNDVSAMLAAFFLKKGKLEAATIHVPQWAHRKMLEDLVKRYGKSTLKITPEKSLLNEWTLPNDSHLLYNNELTGGIGWSAIFWTSHRALESGSIPLDMN